jgi:hypothetical protein
MDFQQIIASLVVLVTLLTNSYDLWLKVKKRKRGPIGTFSGRVNGLLFVLVALAVGWAGGHYSREGTILDLHQEISRLHQQKAELNSNLETNVRIRDKALKFFQDQMQMSSEEFDNLSGHNEQSRTESVVLYEHINFEGKRLFFPLGQYPDLHLYWFGDKTSSIKLIGNVRAEAFEDIDYGGRDLIVHNDIPSLEALNAHWNDGISSIKVSKR